MNKDSKIRKPTRVYGDAWIYEEDPEISKICPNPEWNCGSWLMFFDNSVVDEKWDQAVQLYRQVISLEFYFSDVVCFKMIFLFHASDLHSSFVDDSK